MAYATIKRDYIFIEFLKVAKEYVLLDMFSAFEEASQLTQFAAQKFEAEVQREQKASEGNASASGESSGYDSDSGTPYDTGMHEKKELLIRLPHILLWKVESSPGMDAML